MLVHHPYESFATSVETFLARAAADPAVLAIKHTLYRTSRLGNASVNALMQAAAAGKEVVTLIELTARFDEEANVAWARTLEQAGVHVVYGMVGLKAHGKTTLVVRREGETIRRYGHIGTGNYNPDTARSYEDLGLFTADPAICADLSEFFNYLTAYSNPQGFRKLWVAPRTLRSTLLDLIRRETAHSRRPHHHQGQRPGRPGADRRALPRLPGGGRDRPHRPRRLLPAPGRAGPVRADPGALDRRPLPRALPHLPLRQRRPRPALRDRLGRHDDAQPRPAGRGGDARRGSRRSRLASRQVLEALLADDVLAWQLDASGAWRRVDGPRGANAQTAMLEAAARRAERPSSLEGAESVTTFVPVPEITR